MTQYRPDYHGGDEDTDCSANDSANLLRPTLCRVVFCSQGNWTYGHELPFWFGTLIRSREHLGAARQSDAVADRWPIAQDSRQKIIDCNVDLGHPLGLKRLILKK
ncbi:MAG: hypothetical protein EOS25_00665 [Mesorhizobium sp.]|uniref:hypothetical protein n=1 Tax=Mesorhizobium sp. TaxID=1871066 RepID=UPI000FE9804D|nr:hypothetical protein [Mesorhizobium sp.]RWD47230.1 MAG: hypothetical protein EOS59_19055 [Mesorhizobium sp.]RWE61646.1 MAG: hypothetical protein EOS24_11975 [Mesorhizobium sp.]RWF13378.1 MAG: hypothetical protein EOS69_01440 [Mesorhizobium sp.]RWF22823.1 MAG: hypothetical protein EOS25_00665 [Mesorhizobium sp.]TIW47601.1 MAG: hypothetical protein E5V71_03355 [Mesorhizobium sp.]